MIIFGFRSYVRLLAMLTLVCGACHNPAAHRVVQVTRKFTLFFIPLFPIAISRHTTCSYCGTTSKLSKEAAQQLVASATVPQSPPAPQPGQGQPQPQIQPRQSY
jgi:hypothetical protein